ncbi:MAG: HEAT repeat domain-containing protein [Planctomycetota bacterium]
MLRVAPLFLLVLALGASAGDDEALISRLGADSWREREEAMLACLGRPQLRPLLVAAADGADAEVAWRARWALGCIDWDIDATLAKRAGNPFENFATLTEDEMQLGLQSLMNDERPERLAVLLQASRRFPEGPARQAALANLRSPVSGDAAWAAARLVSEDPATRTGAALVLAWRGDKRGAEALKKDLASANPAFGRQTAIDALIAIGDPAGLESLLGSVLDAVNRKTPPDPEDLHKIAQAPIGTAAVEEALLLALEAEYGAAPGAEQARTAALDGLAHCGGPKTAGRLAAWWEQNPEMRGEALTVAAALADAAALKDLAAKAAAKLGGEKATPDQLFLVAALQRLAGDKEAHRATIDRMAALDPPAASERAAEVALGYMDDGKPGDALEYLHKAIKKGSDPDGVLSLLAFEAATAAKTDEKRFQVQDNYNDDAWELVTHPERLAPPGLAVRLAEQTVKLDPDLAHRGTLGASYFRAGRYEDSIRTLEQNLEPYYFGKEEDFAFMVMSYKRLGKDEDAHRIEAKCREWESKSAKLNPMRGEMERVLREP